MFKNILIVIISLILPFSFLYYIYNKDSVKENAKTLLKAFLGGVFAVLIVVFIYILINSNNLEIIRKLNESVSFLVIFIKAFFRDSLIEEGVKLLVFILLFSHAKDYDDAYDGIVFASFIGIGFGVFENILYLINNNMDTDILLLRTFTSLPIHFYASIFMGYYFSRYKVNKFKNKEYKKFLIYSFLVPFLIHGSHNFVNLVFLNWQFDVKIVVHVLILGAYFATITYLAFLNIQNSSFNDVRIKRFKQKIKVFCTKCGQAGIDGEYCNNCGNKL